MKKILQYGRHFMKAKGRHGTHSPFVYAFVEQVMRAKAKAPTQDMFAPKAAALLYKTIQYLSPRAISVPEQLFPAVKAIAAAANPDIQVALFHAEIKVFSPGTLICVPSSAIYKTALSALLEKEHHIAVLLVRPYEEEETKAVWQLMAALPQVNMSLDYWYFGLLINDPAFKARQHFRLR